MTAVPATPLLTAEEYLALPEDWPVRRRELINGELVVNSPRRPHQHTVLKLASALAAWSERGAEHGYTSLSLDVLVDDRNVYEPDIMWFSGGPPELSARGAYSLPDLAIEVRSPSTWRYDIGAKKSHYEARGLPELWLVDTDAAVVLVFRRSAADAPTFDLALELGGDDTLSSPLLPGFTVPAASIFA